MPAWTTGFGPTALSMTSRENAKVIEQGSRQNRTDSAWSGASFMSKMNWRCK